MKYIVNIMDKIGTNGIVVLAKDGESTRAIVTALHQRFQISHVVLENPVPLRQLLRWRMKKLGFRTAVGQVAFVAMVVPVLRVLGKRRKQEILHAYQLQTQAYPSEIQIHRVPSANSQVCVELLQALQPTLLVLNGTRILSKKMLSRISVPIINMHAGITPRYRGVHGGYWALVKQDVAHFGTTVHLVDSGVDTGQVLSQVTAVPSARDLFTTYPFLQLGIGIPGLLFAVEEILKKNELPTQPAMVTDSKQYFHPTIWAYLWYMFTKGVR